MTSSKVDKQGHVVTSLALGIILASQALGLAGCSTGPRNYDTKKNSPAASAKPVEIGKEARLRVAKSFRDAGDYSAAFNLYKQAIAEDPKNVEALVGIGELYAKLQAYDMAGKSFDQALAADPKNSSALAGMGQVMINQGKPDAALDYLSKAATEDPKNPRIFNSLGLTYDLLGRHGEAQVTYGRGLDNAPDDRALLNNLALSFVLSKNYETAIRILSGLVTAGQAPETSRQNLAMAYGLSGDFPSAEHLLALDLSPDQIKGRLYYFRRLQAATPEAQTRALFLGEEPTPVIQPEQQAKVEATPAKTEPPAPPAKPVVKTPEPATPIAVEKKAVASPPKPAQAKKPMMETLPAPVKETLATPPQPAKITAGSGGYGVQLGAYKSENYALISWKKISKAHPDLFQGFSAAILPIDLGGQGVNYRLYIKEITDKGAARELCEKMMQQKIDCLVRQFPEAPAAAK